MKKRLLALLLAAAMCLSLAACGDQEESTTTKTLAQELGYGYLSEYSNLDVDFEWVNTTCSAQGKLYVSGQYYGDEGSGTKLYEMDPATGATVEIPVPEMVNTDSISEYVQNISIFPDASGYWMLMEHYEFNASELDYGVMPLEEDVDEDAVATATDSVEPSGIPEGNTEDLAIDELEDQGDVQLPEDGMENDTAHVTNVETTEDGGTTVETIEEDSSSEIVTDYQEPTSYYMAKKVDMSGNVLLEVDLTEITESMGYFYPQSVAQNGAGDLLIFSDGGILVVGSDGTNKGIIEMTDGWIQSMAATENGTVVVCYYDSEKQETVACRVEDGKLSDPIEITGFPETGSMNFYAGDGDNLLINDGTLLYSLDVNTGVATKLLSWLDSDINGSNLSGIACSGSDKIMVLMSDFGRNGTTYEVGILTKTPAEEIPERTILTLGGTYLNSDLKEAVIDFNRTNDTYRITFVDYGDYNTEDDYTLAEQQLDRDVISGNCPDIIYLTTGHEQKYISKGALTDLTALLEKDSEMSMDDFLAGPLKAYTVDGKLYGIPHSFSLQSLKVSRKLVGDMTSWDMASFGEIVKNLDDSVEIMKYTSQDGFLTETVAQNLSSFVDYGKATCSFDSQEFKDLLNVASYFPTQEELDAANTDENGDVVYFYDDPDGEVQAGNLLAYDQYISDSSSVKYFFGLYTEENGFVNLGYPQNEGNGALLYAENGLAISAKSKYQEGAWEFIKTTLSDENQLEGWSLPVTQSAFDKVMADAMEKPYYMDGDEKVYYDDIMYIGDTEYPVEPVTQEQLEEFKDYINGAAISGGYDTDIMEIVTEEAGAYFAGDKTADEVAALIQNRVTIYLGETS